MHEPINVVDLFAGPGGLAEGFASVPGTSGPAFKVALSVEKEATAFRTLRLRSFYRQSGGRAPSAYYDYISSRITMEQLVASHPREWDEACRETFQLELGRPETNDFLDPLLDDIATQAGGLSVLVGGPPCQAYSLVGRARNRGTAGYVASEDKRHFLYREYIRILKRLKPAVFVMENVKGILSSSIDGDSIFARVLSDLRSAGGAADSYRLVPLAPPGSESGFVLKCENYGIPQARHRVIVLGIRSDVAANMPRSGLCLERRPDSPNVSAVLSGMARLRSGLSRTSDSSQQWASVAAEAAMRAAHACRATSGVTAELAGQLVQAAEQIARGGHRLRRSSTKTSHAKDLALDAWLSDPKLDCLPNHETRGHMQDDMARYAFVVT